MTKTTPSNTLLNQRCTTDRQLDADRRPCLARCGTDRPATGDRQPVDFPQPQLAAVAQRFFLAVFDDDSFLTEWITTVDDVQVGVRVHDGPRAAIFTI